MTEAISRNDLTAVDCSQDTHINNLQNTCLWNLVKPPPSAKPEFSSPMTTTAAQKFITENAPDSARKNELLFARFGMNYNNEDALFRKGTTIYYRELAETGAEQPETDAQVAEGSAAGERRPAKRRSPKSKRRRELVEEAIDIIGNDFWDSNPYLLARSN